MRVIGIAVICTALAVSASAQRFGGGVPVSGRGFGAPGVPASVTSFGFGGHPGFGGVPASVTSPGFGFVPRTGFGPHTFGPRVFIGNHGPRGFFGPRFRGNQVFFPGSVAPFFPAPVIVPFFDWDEGYAQQPQTIVSQPAQPQPIVIVVPDRNDRDVAERDAPPEPAPQAAAAPGKPEPAPPPTTIVLRNGQKLELTDYAITGDTLYDLHGGRTRKIAVSDIDLPATVKINEEQGLQFTLPNAARVTIQ